MDTSYRNVVKSHATGAFDEQSHPSHIGKHFLIALGIITLVGSVIAAGCLYAKLDNWSFAVGGGGLIVGLVLIAIGSSTQAHSTKKKSLDHQLMKPPQVPLKAADSNLSENLPKDIPDICCETTTQPHSTEKKSLNHQSMKPLQVPLQAADINVSENLPKNIPEDCDISGTKWLSSMHLHYYITYLATRFSGIVALNFSQLADQSSLDKRFSIGTLTDYIFKYLPSQFNNFNNLNVPIYLHVSGNHWTLVYIDRERRTVEYYDSKKNYGNHREIVQKLTTIAEQLSKQEPDQRPYRFICKIHKVLQPDSHQCGPWTLYFLEYRLINPDFDFNQLDVKEAQDLIKKYRIKVMQKLIEMNKALPALYRLEREKYLQYYQDKDLANKMHRQDLERTTHVDRWKQILNGQPLIPGQQV